MIVTDSAIIGNEHICSLWEYSHRPSQKFGRFIHTAGRDRNDLSWANFYSFLKLSTGFVRAAIILWKPTVNMGINNASIPARANLHQANVICRQNLPASYS